MSYPAIRTERLTRDFKNLRAVDNVSLEAPQGAIFGFLGPNGAGKTTMIRLLLGLLDPSSGFAEVFGSDIRSHATIIRDQTGALLEHTGLYERLSAEQNLEFYGRIWRLSPAERKMRIRELLTRFELWERRGDRVGSWSRGMKQKLAVARAILHRPSLLFLDEPTAGLDPVASAALRDDLARLASHEGMTIFLTTHNLNEAEKLCSLVGVISRGKLLAIGHPDELRAKTGSERVEIFGAGFTPEILDLLRGRPDIIFAEPANTHIALILPPNASAAPIVSFLVRRGVAIEEVRKGTASLEEAFLTLMKEEDAS